MARTAAVVFENVAFRQLPGGPRTLSPRYEEVLTECFAELTNWNNRPTQYAFLSCISTKERETPVRAFVDNTLFDRNLLREILAFCTDATLSVKDLLLFLTLGGYQHHSSHHLAHSANQSAADAVKQFGQNGRLSLDGFKRWNAARTDVEDQLQTVIALGYDVELRKQFTRSSVGVEAALVDSLAHIDMIWLSPIEGELAPKRIAESKRLLQQLTAASERAQIATIVRNIRFAIADTAYNAGRKVEVCFYANKRALEDDKKLAEADNAPPAKFPVTRTTSLQFSQALGSREVQERIGSILGQMGVDLKFSFLRHPSDSDAVVKAAITCSWDPPRHSHSSSNSSGGGGNGYSNSQTGAFSSSAGGGGSSPAGGSFADGGSAENKRTL